VDGQRQYPAEPEPWFNEHDITGDDLRVPGQREGGRYADGYLDPRDFDRDAPRDFDRDAPRDYLEPPGTFDEPARYDGTGGPAYVPRVDDSRFESTPPTRRRPSRPVRGRRSGLEMPDVEAPGATPFEPPFDTQIPDSPDLDLLDTTPPPRHHTEVLDRTALRRPESEVPARDRGRPETEAPAPVTSPLPRPTGTTYESSGGLGPAPAPSTVYRPRRAGIAVLLAAGALIAELMLLVKVFLESTFAHPTNVGGVMAGLFALAGVPMIAIGLYGLATGAATAGGPQVGRAWLRTPLAYLPVGLLLIIAAGLAA
jgi:hypothetical protein